MKKDLVTIIIPCYNQAQFLNQALDSVLNQTYHHWECLIINDGSSDNTEEIAKNWGLKDERFQYYFKNNGGVSSARNFGLEKAKGTYIQFLDADDYIRPEKLALSLNLLNAPENEQFAVVISNFLMFEKSPHSTLPAYCDLHQGLFTFENLVYKWNQTFSIPIHCGFFSSALFKDIRFPEDLTAQEDWIVWVSIFKQGQKAIFLDQPLAYYRINPYGRTQSKSLLPDQLIAYEYFKSILAEDEFHKLSVVLISRYYENTHFLKKNIKELKEIPYVRFGIFIRKALKKLGILKPFKKLLP